MVLYKGRNTVGFLSICCTNQPVGIGLVDSWTSPRGKYEQTENTNPKYEQTQNTKEFRSSRLQGAVYCILANITASQLISLSFGKETL